MKQQRIAKWIFCAVLVCCIGVVLIYCYMQNADENSERDTLLEEQTKEADTMEETQTEQESVKEDTGIVFVPFGEEWVEDDIGITILDARQIVNPEKLSEEMYQNPDNWQLGDVGEQLIDPGNSTTFYFLTLQIINYSNKAMKLWKEDSNIHNLNMFGLNNNYIISCGNIVFCTTNTGNTGEALHTFGNFELQPGETVNVTYGFHLAILDDAHELEWYLGDSRLGLEMDVTDKRAVLMCVDANQMNPKE